MTGPPSMQWDTILSKINNTNTIHLIQYTILIITIHVLVQPQQQQLSTQDQPEVTGDEVTTVGS